MYKKKELPTILHILQNNGIRKVRKRSEFDTTIYHVIYCYCDVYLLRGTLSNDFFFLLPFILSPSKYHIFIIVSTGPKKFLWVGTIIMKYIRRYLLRKHNIIHII